MALPREDIEASVFNYFADNYAGTVNWSEPVAFDDDADNITQWVDLSLASFQEAVGRTACDDGSFVIVVGVNSKSQTSRYAAENLADAVTAVLRRNAHIPVQDFSDSDEPVIGYVTVGESEYNDTTERGSVWKTGELRIPSRYQEVP